MKKLTRRRFATLMGTGVVASGCGADTRPCGSASDIVPRGRPTPGSTSADDLGPRSTTAHVDVIVVGAGLAGLSAARDLAAAGLAVRVLEARDRVGGRTQDWDLGDGHVAEGGAQWVGPTQAEILALASDFGIETFPDRTSGNTMFFFEGFRFALPPQPPSASAQRVQARIDALAATIPLASPWDAPHAALLDEQTVRQWLETNDVPRDVRDEIGLSITITLGPPDALSMLYFLFYVRSAGGFDALDRGAQSMRFVGGTQQFSVKMADALGDAVVTSAPVRAISDTTDGVEVTHRGGMTFARHVIVAMMPADADAIVFDPPLPKRRRQLQRRWPAHAGTKLHLVYETPFWRAAGLSGQAITDLPISALTFDASPPDARRGVIGVFPNDANLPTTLEARRNAVVAELVRVFGSAAADIVAYHEKDWGADPWSAGCVSPLPPRLLSAVGSALRSPVGRVHWAGTETAEIWTGYMDGAVRSGRRAANEVVAAIEVG